MNERIYLNNDWYFTEDWSNVHKDWWTKEEGAELDESFCKVRIPHTVKELPLHYCNENDYQMTAGYIRTLYVPKEWEGNILLLTFDGAAHQSTVYVNGTEAGYHNCGYTAFTMDITRLVKYGQANQIAVRLDSHESLDIPPFGFVIDYMTYGGIYRDVYLDIKQQTYIKDIFIRTEEDMVVSEIELAGALPGGSHSMKIRQSIRSHVPAKAGAAGETAEQSRETAEQSRKTAEQETEYKLLGEASTSTAILKFRADHVELWSPESPVLYDVKTEIMPIGREEPIDTNITTIGFRKAEFRKDGFYLNGEKYKIRGLNRHQSYPYVGYAMPDEIQKRDADILKYELGCNAVRTSHYPQSQAFIDRCDELGLLVFTELPGWQHIGGDFWKEQAVANVKDMVLQYRNHPSIILWGVRINESVDDDDFYARTNYMAHALDPSRQTGGVRCYKKGSFQEDVFTYNDFSHTGENRGCERKAKVTSDLYEFPGAA